MSDLPELEDVWELVFCPGAGMLLRAEDRAAGWTALMEPKLLLQMWDDEQRISILNEEARLHKAQCGPR